MRSLKQTLLIAIACIGGFSSALHSIEETIHSLTFEFRLQQISLNSQNGHQLQDILNLYWDWKMAENPSEATFCGYPGYNHLWPDLSIEAIEKRSVFVRQLLDVLISIHSDQFSEEEELNYQLLKKELEEGLEESSYQGYYMLINQMEGIHLSVPMIIQMMPSETVEDYENIIARLNGLKELIDQTIALLEKGLEKGITPPKITLRHVPQQILNQMTLEPLDSPLLTPFKQFNENISCEEQEQLCQEAKKAYLTVVRPSFFKLYSYLVDEYIPHSRTSIACQDLPHGKEWYAFKVKHCTTTSLSPQQIHEIGLQEVQRINQEMLAIINSLGFEGSMNDFFNFLKTDPQFFYSDRQSLLKGYQDLTQYIETQLPTLFLQLPELPFQVVPVPSYSEESQITAYYYPGSPAYKRPGYFFINTSFPETRPKWEMEPLSLHEAVPGHHLQISLSQEIEQLPEFRKYTDYTAYIEGWGLYAESLGSDLGLYRDPYSKFGRLIYEMLRAVRLVVDTGMHAMGWSRQEAIDFFKKYVSMSDHEIITEVDRYLVIPGQALAYKIGELKIKELRQLAKERLGDQFDIRLFHYEWLRQGSLPLDVMEHQILKWVEETSHSSSMREEQLVVIGEIKQR